LAGIVARMVWIAMHPHWCLELRILGVFKISNRGRTNRGVISDPRETDIFDNNTVHPDRELLPVSAGFF
jgi:hypothetical protein